MSGNSDKNAEIHHNVFNGPAALGGTQIVNVPISAPGPSRPSMVSQAWHLIALAWAVCPGMVLLVSGLRLGLFPELVNLAHASTPYVVLAGGVAVCLDVAVYLTHRKWAAVQRATTHPVTWKIRLGGAAVGCLFFALVLMSQRLYPGT